MICVRLNNLHLCWAMLGRIILPASLILCFGAMPIVQVANAQSPVAIFNCSGFASTGGSLTGDCEATFGSYSSPYFVMTGSYPGGYDPSVGGSSVNIMPAACQHCAGALNYQQLVNIQKFKTNFTFVANGWNIAFVANNSNNNPSGNLANFSAGAGCEGGFFQGFAQSVAPNNVFALMYDQYSGLVAGSNSFTDSGVQYYSGSFAANAPNPPGQSPCNPNLGGTDFTYAGVNKVATAPVHMNSPQNATFQTTCSNCTPSTSGVATGDTYSVTITYDGSNLTADMFDVTAGGTCTPVTSGTCSHVTWSGVNIPSMVGGNTAYVGLATSTADNDSSTPLLIHTFSYSLDSGPAAHPLARAHDFNGDGKSDIAWRDGSGDVAFWLMNGTAISSSAGVGAASNWSIVGQRDFNGDGKADVLWRDTGGDTVIWFMDGTAVVSSAFVGNISTNWSVVGTGDFNGDGKGDILWRTTTGDVYIWLMNGSQPILRADLGNIPLSWSVAGVGDFNGDGTTDILWRNTTTGEIDLWQMNGAEIISTTHHGSVSLSWSIAGTGDFNGDGKADILWRNSNGDVDIWLMNGPLVLSNVNLGNVSVSWSITMTGDFNGDGKSDIGWRNTNGDVAIWLMNGLQILSATHLGNVPTAWTMQRANVD
jgi:hypothetical protein